MQLASTTDYAIRIVCYLAAQRQMISTSELSQELSVPSSYIPKITKKLKQAGIIKACEGTNGGYMLAKQPENISLMKIISCVEETMAINRCLEEDRFCSRNLEDTCKIHKILLSLQNTYNNKLESVKVSDVIRPGEDESLETEYQKVSHAKEILSDCAAVHEVTAGQNGCAGDLIGSAVQRLYTVSNLDAEARGLTEQLQTIDSLLNDFNRELSSYIDSMEFDGEQFAEIEERLNLINHLKAKYGDSIEKIQKYHDNSVEKYEKLSNYEEYISEIKRELSKVKEKLDIQCERLTALRKEAAIPLTKLIKEALLDLNFLDVVFEIAFEQSEHYSALGKDNVCFMISTNPGQAVRPLHEIASGGELSRIMLAIKSILADEENIETLIFDEIDTGISGRTAQKVSERLAYIAKKRQVIAITHLPQIAAMADSHYLIEKTSDANSTISNIYPLSEEESVKELARMLGGVKITEAVLQNAREMRALAKQ